MAVETINAIRSVMEAVTIARQARRDGLVIPITPCVQVDPEGKVITCSKVDPNLSTLCTDPDGLLSTQKGMECPLQRGLLRK